ncbi:hypothetical protein KNV37_gp68 [uncultured phage cr110_1]|uniref:Uncharacterized protein n=1 Tax=uncultured phage cr110_1 TaxID=2772070 RepID=A0A7M1RXW0_9CAUD|nr:hypothetical protein KNV37_gp68 [uncultured phage cr110_1]QOR59106.1 hypothetical protein [uncultured phage cr110_1]
MDKIDFKEVGANNIVKYIGKECKIAGKKYIIVGYNIDYPLFILAAVNPEDGIWNDDHAKDDGLVFLIKQILFLRKCLKELLIHIQQLYSCNVVLYDGRYL